MKRRVDKSRPFIEGFMDGYVLAHKYTWPFWLLLLVFILKSAPHANGAPYFAAAVALIIVALVFARAVSKR